MAVAMCLQVASAHAQQRQSGRQAVGTDMVTVLTDGIADPNGQVTLAINELAARLGHVGKMRVLPIAGHGGAENARDLLYLKGVDLAVLNSDILAYLDQTRQYPDARRRLRYVTHLVDQKIYLLARKQFSNIEDLRGRRVIVLSRSTATASALFGLLQIEVKPESAGADAVLGDAGLANFDAALLLGSELSRLRVGAQLREDFRILPILMTQALQKAYLPAVVEVKEVSGLATQNLDTVAVSSLLTIYDWAPSHSRFHSVKDFIAAFFTALPDLRRQGSASVWRQLDINARPPGWTRHVAAEPSRVLAKAALAELALVQRPPAAPPVSIAADGIEKTLAQKATIRMLASRRAPLTDERLPDGGLITALVSGSLNTAAGQRSEIDLRWTKSPTTPIQSLLGDASIDIAFPWEGADCDRPNDLVQASAVFCDNALFTDPLLQVVIALFTLSDSAFQFDTDESVFGKSICIPSDRDVSALNAHGRNWLSEKRIVLVRAASLLECLSIVQRREADAFVATDLEGQYVLGRLGLGQMFRMAVRPLGTRGVHAIVSRENAHGFELVGAVNRGLKELKRTEAYAAIIRQHLLRVWDARLASP
jgi:ABC-type amino acid transport substrate-binding protein